MMTAVQINNYTKLMYFNGKLFKYFLFNLELRNVLKFGVKFNATQVNRLRITLCLDLLNLY